MLPTEVEVLVVGYGPVGAALTALLGRYGVPTLVIDRADDIYHAPRAIALDNEALRILQMVGVGSDFEQVPIPRIEMYSPYVGHFCTLNTAVRIDGHPKLVTFYQPQLDRALRNKAQSHRCVTASTSTQLVEFSESGAGIRATLRTSDGTTHAVTAKYLVGADGANSQVRSAMGLELVGESYDEDWLIVDGQGIAHNIDHVEFICNPRRPVPHMVAPGGRTRWEFMLQPGEQREYMEREDTVRKLLAPWPGSYTMNIERRAVYRFQARSCTQYSRGRVFLCGDAAHVTPPFAGQGLVSGLRDAANLAWKLAWVTQGRAKESMLDSYDEERRPHALAMIKLAQDMGAMIMPRTMLKAILIQGLQKLLRLIPSVRRFLEDWGGKPKNEFGAGLFMAARGKLKNGGAVPQVALDNGLSDEHLGPGFALVGYGFRPVLSETNAQSWRAAGGSIVQLPLAAAPAGLATESCAVIRPDRVLMHHGAAGEADRLAQESMALLQGE